MHDDLRLRQGVHKRSFLERQKAAFEAAGCTKIFSEKDSGLVTDRGALAKLSMP
jgi:DNA invertase Pin-like site-specific DNA recombinase